MYIEVRRITGSSELAIHLVEGGKTQRFRKIIGDGGVTCPAETPEIEYFSIIPCRVIFCSFYTVAVYQQWQFPIN